MTDPLDPALRAGLDEALDWSDGLDDVRTLGVRGARSLAGLPALPKLKSLTLTDCALDDLEPLRALPALQVLELEMCALRDNSALAAVQSLRRLVLRCGDQRELDALLSLPALEKVKAVNTPLSPEAAARLRAQLGERLTLSEPRVMEMSAALADAGIPACHGVSVVDGVRYSLAIPLGLAAMEGHRARYAPSDEALLVLLAEGVDSWEALAARLPSRPVAQPAPQPARFEASEHIEVGDAAQARAWIQALPEPLRAAAGRFIDAWPALRFQRFEPPLFDFAEGLDAARLPPWLRQAWGAFAGLDVDQGVRYHFGGFRGITPDEIAQHAFGLGLRGAVTDKERERFVGGGLYPIGADRGVVLAVNVRDPDDPRVYQLRSSALYEAEAVSPEQALTAFSDFAAMLDAVVAVTVGGERLERP